MKKFLADPALDISIYIQSIRRQRVILDMDLAGLYGVPTHRFNEQVRRNASRFPPDFLFQLTREESRSLRSQNAILKSGRGKHRKYPPLAFTEHGAIMAATILNSPRAIQMSVYVVRAFVRFRKSLATHTELAREIELLKRSVATLDADTRRQFDQVFEAILGLMAAPSKKQ